MHTHNTQIQDTHIHRYRTQNTTICSTYKIAQNRTDTEHRYNNMQHTEQNNTEYREQRTETNTEYRIHRTEQHRCNTAHLHNLNTEHSTDNLNTYRKTLYVNVITYKHLYTR